jgi:cytochrome c peroxidase
MTSRSRFEANRQADRLVRRYLIVIGWVGLAAGALAGCQSEVVEPLSSAVGTESSALVQATPESLCNSDPRVWDGLVSLNVCVGARLFFDETFGGNGRTCGSCHPANNNFTVDRTFIQSRPPSDPLFVNENPSFPLAELETTDLRDMALIRENLDDFADGAHKFVLRSVPHLFSMSTSLTRDPSDGTSASFAQRTGWSGDGVDGGTLRDFANGAIAQHFPKDLGRTPGTSFRRASAAELDRLQDFQLALGRRNELDLQTVRLTDSFAEQGRLDFLDPQIGRCNECHGNAGANARATGKNANFAGNFERFAAILSTRPVLSGVTIQDGGFGGQSLAAPNIAVGVDEQLNGFGDGSFNTAPLIEAADTGPFFHHNNVGSEGPSIVLPAAITFYSSDAFNSSPAGQKLIAQFGTPIILPGTSVVEIAAFLRVLNTFFNLDLAAQRLQASKRLNTAYWDYRKDIQQGLIVLARKEVADGLRVLASPDGPPLHIAQQNTLSTILSKLDAATASSDAAARLSLTADALTLIAAVRPQLGSGVRFTLGTGTLMF